MSELFSSEQNRITVNWLLYPLFQSLSNQVNDFQSRMFHVKQLGTNILKGTLWHFEIVITISITSIDYIITDLITMPPNRMKNLDTHPFLIGHGPTSITNHFPIGV